MNKKMIILIEFAVCVIAIVVISIFGNNPETWRNFEYCKSIELSEHSVELDKEATTYQLMWNVGPTSATVTDVIFITDTQIVDIDENGLVTFKVKQGVTIIIMTTDGSELNDSIDIKFKAPSEGQIDL